MIKPSFEMPAQLPLPPSAPIPPPPMQQAAAAPVMSTDVAVDKFRQLREKRDEIKKRHAQELAPYTEAMTALEGVIMQALNANGGTSIKTPHGTAFTVSKTTYGIADPEEFRKFVEAEGRPDFYENRVSNEALKAYVEAGNPLPPGVKVSTFVSLNVRK